MILPRHRSTFQDGLGLAWESRRREGRVLMRHSQWQSMIQTDVDRFPASQDPSEPLQLALWTDDASFRMTDVDVLEISRKLARAGKGECGFRDQYL